MQGFVFDVIGGAMIGVLIALLVSIFIGLPLVSLILWCGRSARPGLTGPPEYAWPFHNRNHGKMSVKRFTP